MDVKLGKKIVGDGRPCLIIAEVGSNHNQDLRLAKKLIKIAADAGADVVKFQSLKFDELYSERYQPVKGLKQLFKRIEFQENWHKKLSDYARAKNIMFLSSPTYNRAVDILERINVTAYKIASAQAAGNLPLVSYVARKHRPMIISTGCLTAREIRRVVRRCQDGKNGQIILLHCISKYPTAPGEANLNAISFLKKEFGLPVGFSDHTRDFHISIAAVAKGANVIEKHITLDRKMKGPDHFFALEPQELEEMIRKIREVEASFGNGKRDFVSKEEKKFAEEVQMKLVAKKNVKAGEILNSILIDFKRMTLGIPATDLDKVINRKCKYALLAGQPIAWKDLVKKNN